MNNPASHTNPVSRYSQVLGSVLTLIIGTIISIIIFFQIQSWENSEVQNIFEFNAHNRLASLQTDIVRHQEMVSSIAGLFSASQNVTRNEFHDFVKNSLSRYPYIQGFSWNPLIKNSEKKWFTDKAREDGINNFEITELNSDGKVITHPVRDDYVAVYYIEPYLRNKGAVGFNIASNPSRLKAINQARDTGLAVITERIKLVQEKQGKFGYLLLKAIYKKGSIHDTVDKRREHFTGLAVGVFRFSDWIPLTMRETKPLGIDVWITDESASLDKQFLHFHSSRTREEVFKPTPQDYSMAVNGLHLTTTIDILGRQWTFLFAPSPTFINEHHTWQAHISLIAGLVITILLTLYLYSKAQNVKKLANTNKKLLNALNEIKTLQGIIPICSYCHSIRDDEGAWDMLETYLSKHSDASLTHGVCPKCAEKIRSETGLDKNKLNGD